MFLDIIHRLVFCLKCRPVYTRISKHKVSETGFYVRPQVKPTLLGPIDRASSHLRTFRSYLNKCKNPSHRDTFVKITTIREAVTDNN
jgi:hypothetical protein